MKIWLPWIQETLFIIHSEQEIHDFDCTPEGIASGAPETFGTGTIQPVADDTESVLSPLVAAPSGSRRKHVGQHSNPHHAPSHLWTQPL